MTRILSFLLMSFLLSGCSSMASQNYLSVIDHYKWCDSNRTDISEVIACGEQKRNQYCTELNLCSSEGNANVAYFSYLAERQKNGEITATELRWLFSKKINEIEQEALRYERSQQAERQRKNDSLIKMGQEIMDRSRGTQAPQRTADPDLCYYNVNGRQKVMSRPEGKQCPNKYPYRD